MAVPKKRKSHSRTRMQRSHDHLERPLWVGCPQCQLPMARHRVCQGCGHYRGRKVLEGAADAG